MTEKKNKGGRPRNPGDGVTLLHRSDRLKRHPGIRKYLEGVRAGLIADLGPTEDALTTAQRVLIDRVLTKIAILRLIETRLGEVGVFEGGRLAAPLGDNYIAFSNSVRLTLRELGINKRVTESETLQSYIQKKYAGKSQGEVDNEKK